MAVSMTAGHAETQTIGTTLTELTGDTSQARWLVLLESTGTVYVVTDSSVADGAAVPTDREPYSSFPVSIDISGAGKVLIAQDSSGTCTFKVVH